MDIRDFLIKRPKDDITIISSVFPSKLSGFSYSEITWLLEHYNKARVLSSGKSYSLLEGGKNVSLGIREYQKEHNVGNRVQKLSRFTTINSKLLYSNFFNETYHKVLPLANKFQIPFCFTLYPGGGFLLEDEERDQKLKIICSSPHFKKVICTQKITVDYLLQKNICQPQDIKLIFGVVTPEQRILPHCYYSKDKDVLDICFVAHKYNNIYEKGYDIFVATARILAAKYSNIRFHIIGNWGKDDYNVSEIPNFFFYGLINHDELVPFYQNMDIIISPNDKTNGKLIGEFDGFPTGSVTDASIAGVAMLVTDPLNANNKIFTNGKNIEIIERNAEQIAKMVEYYYQNPEKLIKLAQNGQTLTRALYSYEKQILPRIEVFDEIIANTSIRRMGF